MNFIRGSHYPKAPAFADACDQLGLLFWSENNFWGGFGGAGGWPYNGAYPSTSADFDAFDANVLASLTDMIRIHRNHPSIIAWSMGNEDFFNGGPADGSSRCSRSRSRSPTSWIPPPRGGRRRSAARSRRSAASSPARSATWPATTATASGYDNPGIPNMVSEYGADVSTDSPGQLRSGLGQLDRVERHGRPARVAQRNLALVHVRLRQPDGRAVHQLGHRRLLPHPEAVLLLVPERLREGRAADVADRRHARRG